MYPGSLTASLSSSITQAATEYRQRETSSGTDWSASQQGPRGDKKEARANGLRPNIFVQVNDSLVYNLRSSLFFYRLERRQNS